MKFATILREAGLSMENYPNCAEIDVVLYNGKDRIVTKNDVHFMDKLFENNPSALTNFSSFVSHLEENFISSINIKIDENSVILFYKTPRSKIFLRNPINPLDYMG